MACVFVGNADRTKIILFCMFYAVGDRGKTDFPRFDQLECAKKIVEILSQSLNARSLNSAWLQERCYARLVFIPCISRVRRH